MIRHALCLVAAAIACRRDHAPPPPQPPGSAGAAVRDAGRSDAADPALRFTRVTAGDDFTCALTAAGKAYCWGQNEGGQLGAGSTRAASLTPVPVAGEMTFIDVAAGREHACALTGVGQAFCWGHDPSGALGTGAVTARAPEAVRTPLRFVGISAGDQRTCAVTKEGVVYCWGRFSQPSADPSGRGGPEVVPIETAVRFRAVRAGLGHACGIATDSQLYCWGTNTFGELGIPSATSRGWAPPQRVPLGDTVVAVSVSSHGTCAVTAGGAAFCWGANFLGQLGNGSWTERYAANATPRRVAGDQRWRVVSTSGGFTCGLAAGGAAYCWGTNAPSDRLLGSTAAPDWCGTDPPRECSTRPAPVAGNLRFETLSTGASHTCAITTDARLYCWGANDSGQLGTGTTTSSVEPVSVVAPAGESSPASAPLETLQLHPINPPASPGSRAAPRTTDARIMIQLNGAVAEAVITDPAGRRLGFDPATGGGFNEVPEASYDSSGLGTLADDSIIDEPSWKEIYFNSPVDGEYTVTVIGTRAGKYTLAIGGYDVRHRSSWFKSTDVPIARRQRHEYRFQFSAADAGERGLNGRRVRPPNR